jgi:hypothetical protein
MDPDALDRMDEFFDFAALEQNTGIESAHASREQIAAYFQPDNVTTIDWAMAPAAQDAQLYDLPMYDVAHDLSPVHMNQQWPSSHGAAYSASSIVEVGMRPRANNIQYMKDTGVHDAADIALQPSLPSPIPLMQCDDEGGLFDASHAQLEPPSSDLDQSMILTNPSLDLEQLPLRSVVSQQQPSNATWKPASAKRKGPQCRIPLEARQILEDEFAANPYPCTWELDIIAHQANLDVKKVRNWFNNTRARKKCGGEYHTNP